MFDYHIHSKVSYDGHATPQEMAQAAADVGLKEICFTDHLDYQLCVPREKTAYKTEIYRQSHDSVELPGLMIRHGAEVGLATWNKEEAERDISAYPYDFILGSVHFIEDGDPYLPPYWVGRDPLEAEQQYFLEILKCVQIHDNFDVLGHLTYISKCKAHPCPRVLPVEEFKDIVAAIMETLIAKGKGLEVNTSGVNRCGDFLPGIPYLKMFRELGGELVTVGSDAHTLDRVGQYIGEATEILKDIFGYVCTFECRKPIFHKL